MDDPIRHVRRRSKNNIEDLSRAVRTIFGLGDDDRVALIPLLEFGIEAILEDFRLEVLPDAELHGVEGLTDLTRPIIRLPEEVYNRLRQSCTHARFTAAHELGHLFMHSGDSVHYARTKHADETTDPEWQANQFAACFLMPEAGFRKCATIQEAMQTFGVGYRAANARARSLGHKFRKSPKKRGLGMSRTP